MGKLGVFLVFFCFISYVYAECAIPEDGIVLESDTLLCYGEYSAPEGLKINADDMTLDCNNSVISGNSLGNGILIDGRKNVSVKNCIISNYEIGVYLKNSAGNEIIQNNIENSKFGIALYQSPDNKLGGNTFADITGEEIFTYSVPPVNDAGDVPEGAMEKEMQPEDVIEQIITMKEPGMTDPEKEKEIELMLKKYLDTNENLIIKREFIYNKEENSTLVILRINPKKPFKDLKLYEHIPKCIGMYLSDIVFKDTNFKIIKEDPLIMWHFGQSLRGGLFQTAPGHAHPVPPRV